MKRFPMCTVLFLIQIVFCNSAASQEISSNSSGKNMGTYQPTSIDGTTISRPVGCGHDGSREDSFSRDLGTGVSMAVIPTYDGTKRLSVNILFKYRDGSELKLAPEKLEVHSRSSKKRFSPVRLHVHALSSNADGGLVKEVYVEFAVEPKAAKRIAVVFPNGTVSGDYRVLQVSSVQFDRTGDAGGGNPTVFAPCIYATEPPFKLTLAQLKSLPVVPLKPLNLKRLNGSWVVDGKASVETFKSIPMSSKDEFLTVAGWMFALVYEFDNGVVSLENLSGLNKTTYRLVPEMSNATKFVYKAEIETGSNGDLLSVYASSGDSIRISSFNDELMQQFLYKRIKWDPKAREKNVKAAMDALVEFSTELSATSRGK